MKKFKTDDNRTYYGDLEMMNTSLGSGFVISPTIYIVKCEGKEYEYAEIMIPADNLTMQVDGETIINEIKRGVYGTYKTKHITVKADG